MEDGHQLPLPPVSTHNCSIVNTTAYTTYSAGYTTPGVGYTTNFETTQSFYTEEAGPDGRILLVSLLYVSLY